MNIVEILTILATIIASTGLWTFIQSRFDRRSASTQLLLGLAHDRIIALGMEYLERGWVTKDEYDDLIHYLWNPYSKFGGNGLADKVKSDVDKLPIYQRGVPLRDVQAPDKEKND